MNQQQSLGFVAVIAVVAGLTGVTALGDISFVENDVSSMNTSVPLSGHMIIQVTDDEGNIKNYMQTDNVITSNGKDCTGKFLFGVGTCDDNASVFTNIELSSNSFGDTAGTADLTNTQFNGKLTTAGLQKSTSNTVSQVAPASGTGSVQYDIVHTFSYSTGGSQTVQSAALMNTLNSLFAIKNFPSAVSLNPGDDLTVTWQITLGP